MRIIELSNGGEAVVDDEDYEKVSSISWRFHAGYARGVLPTADGRQRNVLMHRLLIYVPPGFEVDHINRNGLDNRRANLRTCTKSENAANREKVGGDTSSKYKGVHRRADSGKWMARIKVNGRRRSLGCFYSEEEAALAYNVAATEEFGEFARVNVVR